MEHKHIEGKGKPLKVVAPEGTPIFYLTAGRTYKVTGYLDSLFKIKNDTGAITISREKGTPHLKGGNWIVTEREPEN